MVSLKPAMMTVQPSVIEEETVSRIIEVLKAALSRKKPIRFPSLKNSINQYFFAGGLAVVLLGLLAAVLCDPRWSPLKPEMQHMVLRIAVPAYWAGVFVSVVSQYSSVLPLQSVYYAANRNTEANVALYNELRLFPKAELEFAVLLFRQHLSREISPATIMVGDLSRSGFIVMLMAALSSIFALTTKGLGSVFTGIVLGAGIILVMVMLLAVFANAAVARAASVADIADYVVSHAYPDKE